MLIRVFDNDVLAAEFKSNSEPRYYEPTGDNIRSLFTERFHYNPFNNQCWVGQLRTDDDTWLYTIVVEAAYRAGYRIEVKGEPQPPPPLPPGAIP